MGKRVGERREVLAVREPGNSKAEEATDEDILPVVTVVHRTADGHERGSNEWNWGNPCFQGVPTFVEKVELASNVEE